MDFHRIYHTHIKQRQGEAEDNRHIKTLRRYYILCLLMYCTNTQRPTLLHTLLADTIEMCGGSRKLLKILNQFGAVSSPDTHDRFVTDVATRQRNKTVWDDLSDQIFTLASVDNFDMLQSHSMVYCGDQQRSYHGTTVQLVQPNPNLHVNVHEDSICTSVETNTTTCSNGENRQVTVTTTSGSYPQISDTTPPKSVVSLKRKCAQSPASSPHSLGKVGPKRPRTVKPRKLAEQLQAMSVDDSSTANNMIVNSTSDTSTITSSTPTADIHTSNSTPSDNHLNSAVDGTVKPNMQGFMEGPIETNERETLHSKLFAYTLAKDQMSSKEPRKILYDFKEMYAQSSKCETTQSNIYYMELVDENPDSTETMRYVSELLLQNSATKHQDSYIILIQH